MGLSSGRRKLAALLVLGAAACSPSNPTSSSEPSISKDTATVVRVIDGDSLELNIAGNVFESRLIGINAPELSDCQGPLALTALSSLAVGQQLTVQSFGVDRFDRLLVELELGNASINEALVRTGWALALHDEKGGDWLGVMGQAADSGLGMWDLPDVCERPEDEITISGIEPDPPGPDDEVLEDEWIELHNPGDRTVSLDGWTLRDESSSNRFVFGDISLAPNERLRLHTGCGDATAGEIYWCSDNGVWSNRGETALLLGPSGAIVDHLFVE